MVDFEDKKRIHIKAEKEKARKLRKSRWWSHIIATKPCYYCKKALSPETVTMDHVIPVSLGGHTSKGNVVPSCKTCNTLKKDMTPLQWLEFTRNQA